MSQHSSIVGGSTAARLLNCPGSFKATQALPPSADTPSVYAEEGTAMHKVMDALMRARMTGADPLGSYALAEAMIGQTFHDRVLTREHIDTMIAPALSALDELEENYGGNFDVGGVEVRVQFPNLPGAFGTCDLILVSKTHTIICDWKFGQGVPVQALYAYEDGDELNAQLMYYLAGAMRTKHRLFIKRKLVIAIVQPRTDDPLTHTEVTRKDVSVFREDLERAVLAAVDRDPPLKKGEHCRWCPAKIHCPLWTTPIAGLAEALGQKPPRQASDHLVTLTTPYGEYLAKAKALVDLLAPYIKEVNEQLHTYLTDGGVVPGWRLKSKAKNRQWIDDDVVAEALLKIGFTTEQIWQEKLVTFQSADATARKLGVRIPDELRVAPPSTETTIAPTSDPAPVLDVRRGVAEFAAALGKLT